MLMIKELTWALGEKGPNPTHTEKENTAGLSMDNV